MPLIDLTMKRTPRAAMVVLTALVAVLTAAGAAVAQNTARAPDAERFYSSQPSFALLPEVPIAAEVRSEMTRLQPRIGIEVRSSIPVSFDATTPEGRLRLYNTLRAVHTMEGIEYYSASRGHMRTLYFESYRIASAADRSRVEPAPAATIPPRDTLYAYQRDGSFGRNVQRIDLWSSNEALLMGTTNETTMFYNMIPLLRAGNLRTFVLVQPQPHSVEVYAHLGAAVGAMFGFESRAQDSLYNRVVALLSWLENQLQ